MTELFGISLDTLSYVLVAITVLIVGLIIWLAFANRVFFKIGIRNIGRRRSQMALIIFALMLSTTLLSSALATGNVITSAVQNVAVYNLGNVDELIEGGHSGFFDDSVYRSALRLKQQDPDIAAVSAALVENDLLIADTSSRQVRSKVTGLGIVPGSETGFGGMKDNSSNILRIANLKPNAVYLNQTTARLLNAHAGDKLYLYAQRWPGKRYQMQVQGIVADGGLAAQAPYLLTNISTFHTIENRYDDITRVYIANRGGGGLNGVGLSGRVTNALSQHIPDYVHVETVKADGVANSLKAEDIFSRIFTLFCLFVLAISLLLIFLIFVLLAAERRTEMGMARAIGVRRGQLVQMFLFEGAVYDLIAAFIGVAVGVGMGIILVSSLGPILARIGFPLTLKLQPSSLIIAYCLGVIFTFFSVVLASWLVSRMTIVDALRNLPEPDRPRLTLFDAIQLLVKLGKESRSGQSHANSTIWLERIPDVLLSTVRTVTLSGILPLLVGCGLLTYGLKASQILPFSLGLSLFIIGVGLLLKILCARILAHFGIEQNTLLNRLFAALAGLTIVAYWALPFDVLARLGLPRFQGGIEVFFIAGSMMVLGAAWAIIANAEVIMGPLLKLCSFFPTLHVTTRLASAYPLLYRFRTGLSVVMFSLVIFAMTVMAVITNAIQNNYANINVQTGGYDIQAVSYFKPISDIRTELAKHGINPQAFSAIGERSTTVSGLIQLNAQNPAWHIYPTEVVDGGFLQGYGLHLVARAKGFNSDSDVWQALQTHPNYALIDDDALPYPPNYRQSVYDPSSPSANAVGSPNTPPGLDPYYAYSASGIYQGVTSFNQAPVWVTDLTKRNAMKLTIIGVVNNSDGAHFGLYVNHAAYGNVTVDPSTPDAQAYYFKVAPGQDKRALALALGSAFLNNGLETTVLEDAILQTRGPSILISDILLGMVGLVLLFGVAALAITGTRAVVERRQQIGMIRALGGSRRLVENTFMFESFFVGVLGSALGVVLGLVLSRNIFAANFFEQYNTGLFFTVPWEQLALIIGFAIMASLLAAILPAWQAGRVRPTEALRY
ncbi:MAG TPA: FtsX-like permease family protein [Ktedonobacteraceae bacterium]|nr:FtsX-like permease family protein [Ktedonobacteraceae bacterium]